MTRFFRGWNSLERWLLVVGLSLCTIYGAALLHRTVASRAALADFDDALARGVERAQYGSPALPAEGKVDFTLWSEKRVRSYHDARQVIKGAPMAVLSIERLKIRAPVFEGTDDLILNRGVGWIAGTSRPGVDGNIGIAGHRDGFFRALKDIKTGDRIELARLDGVSEYLVDQIEIVPPNDVSVLRRRPTPSLTLVTCYPFYFVGDAPQRWIVHASLTNR